MIHLGKKLICNSGYYSDLKHQLNSISRSTAAHSTLVLNNNSVSHIKKDKKYNYKIQNSFKVFNKKIISEKNYWNIKCSHDGYLKKYGVIHQRELIFYPEINKLVGKDSLLKKKKFKTTNFEIRFHFTPDTKVTKTQDGKAILIELENSGWRFYCKDHLIDIDSGLYFGNKNSSVENQNIYISGITQNEDQIIDWEIKKI